MRRRRRQFEKGITLLELMIVVVIAGLLATIAFPKYDEYVQRSRVAKAIGDISSISLEIEKFRLANEDRVPDTLAELTMEIPLDPWDQSYQFLKIAGGGPGVGGLRKDGRLKPLNTDFDLYSMGKDGDSKSPLSAKASRDDIVRANNGTYIGLGEDY